MNARSWTGGVWLGVLLTALFVAGCATKPKTDWNARVGTYTFDQAVTDMGPPDREVTMSDGRRMAEWVTGHSGGSGFTLGVGSYGRNMGVGVSQSLGSGGFERKLRLTFNLEGRLESWKSN